MEKKNADAASVFYIFALLWHIPGEIFEGSLTILQDLYENL